MSARPTPTLEQELQHLSWAAVMNVMRQAGWVFTFKRARMQIVAPDGESWGELFGLAACSAFFMGAFAWAGTRPEGK